MTFLPILTRIPYLIMTCPSHLIITRGMSSSKPLGAALISAAARPSLPRPARLLFTTMLRGDYDLGKNPCQIGGALFLTGLEDGQTMAGTLRQQVAAQTPDFMSSRSWPADRLSGRSSSLSTQSAHICSLGGKHLRHNLLL